jgi:hypothetical protein
MTKLARAWDADDLVLVANDPARTSFAEVFSLGNEEALFEQDQFASV